ncbi:MAG TPA: tetratricopeptide repeat protein [Longimicrobium sp.]|nr:tetratricopeptide repeat protein [Longimicrobium sp.]
MDWYARRPYDVYFFGPLWPVCGVPCQPRIIMQRKSSRSPRGPVFLQDLYPLLVPPSEPPGHTFILELGGAEAIYVTQAHRLVLAWCLREVEPDRFDVADIRALLRELADTSLTRDVRHALVLLAREFLKKRIDPHRVALACLAVGDCAVARGARKSALLWSEAAACVVPLNPRFAWLAGKLYRKWEHYSEAEYWLERAARVAVRINERYTQALALNSLGNLYRQMGNYARSVELLNRALMRARRHRLDPLEGEILHDLALLSAAMDRFRDAEKYAVLSFARYGNQHPNLPKLACDVAFNWANQGFFDRAYRVYQSLLRQFEAPHERLRVLSAMVRCAGAIRDQDTFDQLWSAAWKLAQEPLGEPVLAAALVDMGKGAVSISAWERATTALEWAVRAAEASGEADMLALADAALSAAHQHLRIDVNLRDVRENSASDRFADSLTQVLDHPRREPAR